MHSSFFRLTIACLMIASIRMNGEGRQSSGNADGPAVILYFRAMAGEGELVPDLKSADVSVKIAGQPRSIRSIELLDFQKPGSTPGAAPTSSLPAPFVTNEGAGGGRDLIVVVDDASVSPASISSLQESLTQLVAALSPRDRVGLLSVRGGGANVALTARHETVRASIAALRAQGGAAEPCRGVSILETLKNLIGSLRGGSPTTVVFFSTGAISDACGITMDDWRAFGATVQRTFTNFYIAQVFEGGGARSGFLDNLAGMSGAEMVRLTGDTSRAMTRIARETSACYRLLLEPDRSDRNGTTQRVEMRTTRAGVQLAGPTAVTFALPDRAASPSATPANMLRGAVPQPDLPLRLATFPSRNAADDKVKVVVMFEPIDPSSKIAAAMVAVFDEGEQSVAQWTARRSDLSSTPVIAALPVPAGKYRLRVAAVDASGKGGAADADVNAVLVQAGSLKFSAIVLGSLQDGRLTPRLQFGPDPAAIAYLELYGAPSGALSVRFELSASDGGPAIVAVPGQVGPAAAGGERSVSATIPLTAISPGDFLLRAIVSVDGKAVAEQRRTLRKQAAQSRPGR